MAIWIGEAGGIRIQGPSSERIYSRIEPSDVNAGRSRFDFKDGSTALITGDRIWIRRITDQGDASTSNLDFVQASGWGDGQLHPDGEWFVNVDPVGGVRLFSSWADAINDTSSNAVGLQVPATGFRVSLEVVEGDERCLAQTVGWTLNTDREVADFTSLGDGFKQQMSTLVSGSGELDCLFDFNAGSGDDRDATPSVYMHKLALRQDIGARFTGVFLMKRVGALPLSGLTQSINKELFYHAECVVTGVATELVPGDPIHSRIRFVTTGPIQLVFGFVSAYLLQEQAPNDKILKESGFGILLETAED